jgi:hypothetical protein
MKKYLLLIALPCLLFSCKNKKASLADNAEVDVSDFIEFFQPVKLPYQTSDTTLTRHMQESLRIGNKSFEQFVPDTLLTRYFGKTVKPRLYASGKVAVKKNETYFFVKALAPAKKLLYVLVLDKDNKFKTGMPLIIYEGNPRISWLAGMDAKYTISVTRQRKNADGQVFYKRDAYVYSEGAFILILTESNESSPKTLPVINPIDTLSHKHKFTGDYVHDKRNFISVRDGKDASHILFFVHFEKAGGSCRGELKGQARFINATTAQYRSNSDPCAVEFSFNGNAVRMKELGGCGNHRDIKCYFEGQYSKQKESKAKPVKR